MKLIFDYFPKITVKSQKIVNDSFSWICFAGLLYEWRPVATEYQSRLITKIYLEIDLYQGIKEQYIGLHIQIYNVQDFL